MTRPAEAPVWDACACVDMRAGKLCRFLRLGDGRLGNEYFTRCGRIGLFCGDGERNDILIW